MDSLMMLGARIFEYSMCQQSHAKTSPLQREGDERRALSLKPGSKASRPAEEIMIGRDIALAADGWQAAYCPRLDWIGELIRLARKEASSTSCETCHIISASPRMQSTAITQCEGESSSEKKRDMEAIRKAEGQHHRCYLPTMPASPG
jgi:hypothetical protein